MKKIIILAVFGIMALVAARADAQSLLEMQNGIVSGIESVSSEAGVLAAKFVKQIDAISKVKIDTTVLKSSAFRSLTDLSQPLPQEPKGRNNPFAPF